MKTPNNMPVVHSVQRWLPQTETWLHTQVAFLPATIETHVVCESQLNLDQFPHPRIHCFADASRWRRVWDRALRKLRVRSHLGYLSAVTRRVEAQLLHSHYGWGGYFDRRVPRRLGIAHVVTFYGIDVHGLPSADVRWRARYMELFSTVDAVLCEGPHMGECIVNLGCPREKMRVHHLGIDLQRFPYTPRSWQPGQPLRVLLCGSFREKKGFPDAIAALGRIKDLVDLDVTVIGDAHGEGRSMSEKARIIEALKRSELGERVKLLGYQPHRIVMELARTHHVFLSPSVTASDGDTEGGAPVTLIEMSASGMMIVSTTHCDIPGVILHGKSGLLAREADVAALAGHLEWIIANPGAWRGFQDAGRAHIESEFDARIQGERLGAIYRELIISRQQGGRA